MGAGYREPPSSQECAALGPLQDLPQAPYPGGEGLQGGGCLRAQGPASRADSEEEPPLET